MNVQLVVGCRPVELFCLILFTSFPVFPILLLLLFGFSGVDPHTEDDVMFPKSAHKIIRG